RYRPTTQARSLARETPLSAASYVTGAAENCADADSYPVKGCAPARCTRNDREAKRLKASRCELAAAAAKLCSACAALPLAPPAVGGCSLGARWKLPRGSASFVGIPASSTTFTPPAGWRFHTEKYMPCCC